MAIGDRIKAIRNKLDMSQVDFADKINVSKQTLYKYENNIITNVPYDKIEAIALVGNVSPAYLMGWEDNDIGERSMFFEKLSTLCDEKGIKPNTIAKAIGLSSAVATKWKSGALPNGETLCRIADYLECSVDYLLDRSDMKKDNPEGPPPENIDNEILNMAAKMSPEDRKALIAYMEFLVERRKHTDGNPQ